MSFTPRLTAPTDFTTWYGSYNSWNRFSRYDGNCTWYAYGRTGEIADRNIYDDFYITQAPGNGKDWIYNSWPDHTVTSGSVDIVPGDILVWGGGTHGHVEVVEQVFDDGSGNISLNISYSIAGNTWADSLEWGLRQIPLPAWGSPLGSVRYNDGSSGTLSNPLIGVIHNKYADVGPIYIPIPIPLSRRKKRRRIRYYG